RGNLDTASQAAAPRSGPGARARGPQAPDRVRLRLGPGHVRRALLRAPPHRGRPAARDPGSLEGPVGHHLAPDAPKSPRTPLRQPQSRARHPPTLARQEHPPPPPLTAATGNAWESRPPTTVPIPPTSGPGHTSLAPFFIRFGTGCLREARQDGRLAGAVVTADALHTHCDAAEFLVAGKQASELKAQF